MSLLLRSEAFIFFAFRCPRKLLRRRLEISHPNTVAPEKACYTERSARKEIPRYFFFFQRASTGFPNEARRTERDLFPNRLGLARRANSGRPSVWFMRTARPEDLARSVGSVLLRKRDVSRLVFVIRNFVCVRISQTRHFERRYFRGAPGKLY